MTAVRIAATVLAALVTASAAGAVVLRCDGTSTSPGAQAVVHVVLDRTDEEPVAGTQNDLEFDAAVFALQGSGCAINPAIGEGSVPDKRLSIAVTDTSARAIIVALDNVNVIPAGELYTCSFRVAFDVPLGQYHILNTRQVASSPDGTRLPVTGTDCVVSIGPTPTPTPKCRENSDCPDGEVCVDGNCVTPTITPTPIGFCTDDNDCPPGEICVDHRCVTKTPTPIGFCNNNDDCPEGQVCVDHHCVTPTPTPQCRMNSDCPSGQVCVDGTCQSATPTVTPTSTPKKQSSGGGGGCSCEIDPSIPRSRMSDVLAVLLPALVLLLRWRARRAAG
jgi:Cys-rich repeat protein